jgi:hypothetical protein
MHLRAALPAALLLLAASTALSCAAHLLFVR